MRPSLEELFQRFIGVAYAARRPRMTLRAMLAMPKRYHRGLLKLQLAFI